MQSKNNYIMLIIRLILACNFYNERAEITKMFGTLCFIIFVYFVKLNSFKIWKLWPDASEVTFFMIVEVKVWLLG